MFIIGYWCDCQEKEPEQEQEQEQDILTVGKEIYEHRYCTYEKLALKLARQTNAGQTDRQTGPGRAHMRRGSGFRRSTKFLLFSFRVLFLFFFFACLPFGWFLVLCTRVGPAFLPYLRWYFSAVPFVLCYIPLPPLSLFLILPPLRLAICLIVRVLVFPFTFSVMCAEAAWRETGRQRGGRGDAYILLVLVVDIYFMSQITFIGTWHTLEIHVYYYVIFLYIIFGELALKFDAAASSSW